MEQIIYNYLCIFFMPAIIGFAIRFLFRHAKKAYFITVCFIIFSITAWAVAKIVPSHGSELNGILALMITSMAFASFLTGLIIHLR